VGFRTLQYVTESWKMALDIEKTQLQFQIFTGSLGTAQKLMGELRQIAATTSLTLDVSLQSTRTLLQYGVAAQEVTHRLKQLGDIAGGDTERMQRLSLAFGQITAQGRLQGQELRQLVEAGFNPLAEIARITGRSMISLRVAMAEGKISIEDVQDALDAATSEGGRFYGQLDKVAKLTTSGAWQVAMGQLKELGAEIFGEYAKATKRGADNIATAAEQTKTLLQRFRDFKQLYRDLRPRYDFLGRYDPTIVGVSSGPGMTRDFERGEDRFRRNYAAEAEEEADAYNERAEAIQQSIADRIVALQRENEVLREGADAVELRRMREEELAATGETTHSDELEKAQQESARLKQEKKDAERRQREDESALRADQRTADRLMKQYEDPLTTAGREQAEIARLERQGMITPEVAAQERERITKEYLASQVDEIVEAEKESAAVAGKNSKEEFEMLRRISTKNASTAEKLEQKRHDEQQAELNMINTGISLLPEAISSLLPQAI
jgi:tape measure domain-containing protein